MAYADLGPICIANGINSSMLLSFTFNVPTKCASLPEVAVITNELVLDLLRFKDHHPQCTFRTFYEWVKYIYGKKWPDTEAPTCQAITRSISRLTAHLSKLKKQDHSPEKVKSISEFLQCEYILPSLGLQKGKVQHFSPVKKQCNAGAYEGSTFQAQGEPSKKYQDLKQRMYAITRNANKRLKRRETVIQQQRTCIDSQRHAIQSYERKINVAESQLLKLKAKLNRVGHRASYWRSKVDGIDKKNSFRRVELRHEIESLREKISSLDLQNAEMSETIDSILRSETIATFEGGKYTDDVRACIYELLLLNVGVSNIAPVIRCVLKNIAHKSASRLPSHGLTCQMILESLTVVQTQLGDQLSQAVGYNTLQTDGTTKFGDHYGTYDVSVASSGSVCTYGLGL